MRKSKTGGTRNDNDHKFRYEGFICPEVLYEYGAYMHSHRKQKDGTIREPDNWQKGMELDWYADSLVRHTIDFWRMHRGFEVVNPDDGKPHTKKGLLCAIMFNAMGYLYELLTKKHNKKNTR